MKWLLLLPVLLVSCAAVSRYDETSYQQVTRCKAEALTVVQEATTPYENHLDEINTLKLDLLAAYEYDAGRTLNNFSIQMWDIILNEQGHTLAGFLVRWKTNSVLSQSFVSDQRSIISRSFNQLIDAENGKIHE